MRRTGPPPAAARNRTVRAAPMGAAPGLLGSGTVRAPVTATSRAECVCPSYVFSVSDGGRFVNTAGMIAVFTSVLLFLGRTPVSWADNVVFW